MRRCTRCVLPDTIYNIEFDENGVCNHCRGSDKAVDNYDFTGKGEEFERIIEEQRQRKIAKNLKYDVLVAVSGGRDSSYVVWKLATEYGLNVLCANYDNPFTTEQARKNIEILVEKLGLDLVRFSDKGSIHKKSFRTNLLAWMKDPELSSVGLLCLACQSLFLSVFDIAKKNDIELIIAGANPYEITGFKMEAVGVEDLDKHRIRKMVKNYSKKLIKNRGYVRLINFFPALKAALGLYGDTPYLRWRYPNLTKTAYFYFFPYNEEEIDRTLHEIGWRKAPDNPSPWRFDCEVDSIKNYIFQSLIGATEKDDMFSRYIRAGLMSREEALGRLDVEGKVNLEIVKRVLGQIGIELSQLDEALERARSKRE
jgi:hypothetical protein